MPQRILNILHLLLWTPLYLWILFLRLIVILAYVQTTHPLHLCNIRSMHIHTILILHIFLNLLISSLLLWCIIPLFFKLHHNLLHIISRQQYHRLNMQRHLCWNTHFLPRVLQKNTHLYHSTSHDYRSFLSSSLLSTQPFHKDSYIGLWHMVCFCHPYPLAQMSAYTDQLCHPLPYHRQRLSPQYFQILLCQIHQVHQPL